MRADPGMRVCRCCKYAYDPESFRVIRGTMRRAKCRACEANCTPGGSAHKSRVQRANRRRGYQQLVCQSCGVKWGRPIQRGGLHKRCPSCRTAPRPPKTPDVIKRVLLGPCPCHDCGASVTWNGYAWESEDGTRHLCPDGSGPGVAYFTAKDTPESIERKMADAFSPVTAILEAFDRYMGS